MKHIVRMKFLFCLLLILGLSWEGICAESKHQKLGIIVGQWQPNLLRDEKTTSVFAGDANSIPYLGVNYNRVLFKEINIQLSIGYWSHLYEDTIYDSTLTILPIEIGVEHQLIANSAISPYVLYGAGIMLGRIVTENKLKKFSLNGFSDRGFELYLLTGIRVSPFRSIELNLNFGYVYAKFPEKIGSGEDYSGVRASLGINYLF